MTAAPASILDDLARVSSAEDIFAHLGVDFSPEVLNISRLHVMKRFGAYLAAADFTGQDPDSVTRQCRAALQQAHNDFTTSTPLQQKVFKVFETQANRQKAKFVSLDALTIKTTQGAGRDAGVGG